MRLESSLFHMCTTCPSSLGRRQLFKKRSIHKMQLIAREVFTGMNSHMPIQATVLRESLGTRGTYIRLFSSVRSQVSSQVTFLRESLGTRVTYIRLFSSVRSQVNSQLAVPREALGTRGTTDGFLPTLPNDHSAFVRRERGANYDSGTFS